jgi:hypothetical protein
MPDEKRDKKLTCRIYDAGDGGTWFRTPYERGYVDELKKELPAGARQWSEHRRAWWIDDVYLDEALEVAERYFVLYLVDDSSDDPVSPVYVPDSDGWTTLWLKPGAPPEVVKAAYRALARLNHPDAGGDEEMMKEINAAYEGLKSC